MAVVVVKQIILKFTVDGFALAKTRNTPAISEFDIHIFVPLII